VKTPSHLKTFFLILFMLSYLCVGGAIAFPGTDNLETRENTDQGIITLFSQNYSETNSIPNNFFIAKFQRDNICDSIYSIIYGMLKPQIIFNGTSKGLEYRITRDSCLLPYSLLPVTDTVLDLGIKAFQGNLMKSSETKGFCEVTSIPLVHYREQPRQTGSLYICNLTPMVKCTYQVSMDINTDGLHSCVELNSPGSKLIIQEGNNNTALTSYFKNSSGDIKSETICIGNARGKSNFEIRYDGYNKTNTICAKDGSRIATPFYDLERQRLPYADFSNGYLKFTTFLMGEGTYLDVEIYSINQEADRKLITPIGNNKILPFGIDGPHARNTTEQGINYLGSKNDKGTIWVDRNYLEQYTETDLEYLRNLVATDSWDVGVHYSEELNSFSLEQAYKIMDEEYSYVYEKIGRKPTTWCSMRNRDNVTHAIYAYEELGMFWRNGDSGVNAEKEVGNLDDDTWEWWESVSRAGMVYPVFTHKLDQEPAIKYSISSSKFRNWVDNYFSKNVSIVSFYEYSQINRNTYDAHFDDLEYNEHLITFDVHTNGARALINVNISAGKDTQVYDSTSNKFINYATEKDKSITFWVENNHTYNIYLDRDCMLEKNYLYKREKTFKKRE
jgi:hypothetical protein